MLDKTLGLGALSFYAIGMILGAGIYSVIGAAAGEAGHGLWLSFLLAAVAAGLTALSYAELATAYPRAGAEVVYAGAAFPDLKWAPSVIGAVLVLSKVATAT